MTKRLKLQNIDKCKELGFIFQDKEYLGRMVKHNFFCLLHRETHICTADQILVGKGLACCDLSKFRKSRYLDFDSIKLDLLERGFEVQDKEYTGIKSKYQIRCLAHKEIHYVRLENMVYRKDNLICCKIANARGINSSWYNPSITDVERLESRDRRVKYWRELIYERDNYCCQKCKQRGYRLNAHHIFNWKDNPDLRYDQNNGITMCERCHKLFHKTYGIKNNNKKQLTSFIEDFEDGIVAEKEKKKTGFVKGK